MKYSGTILLLLAMTVGGCGGSGDGDSGDDGSGSAATPSPIEGVWTDWSNSDSTGGQAVAIALDDGRYWLLENFLNWLSFGPVPMAVTLGSGSGNTGTFRSQHARQFSVGVHGAQDVDVEATYTAQKRFDGTVKHAGEDIVSFSFDSYDPQYAQPFALNRFDGLSLEGLTVIDDYGAHGTVNFGTGGAFSGTLTGSCNFHGTLTARAHGSVFDLSVSNDAYQVSADASSPGDCSVTQYRGVAYPANGELYMVASDTAGNALFLFAGAGPIR